MERREKVQEKNSSSRMPEDSVFFERVVPILLGVLGLLMVLLVLFAIGVLIGVVHF